MLYYAASTFASTGLTLQQCHSLCRRNLCQLLQTREQAARLDPSKERKIAWRASSQSMDKRQDTMSTFFLIFNLSFPKCASQSMSAWDWVIDKRRSKRKRCETLPGYQHNTSTFSVVGCLHVEILLGALSWRASSQFISNRHDMMSTFI